MSRTASVLAGLVAAGVATVLMFGLRTIFQIRTLPERLTEWALLFVPPEQFEMAITTFGTQAKVYALYGAVAVMVGVLAALGALAVRDSRGPWLVGGLLWLLAMAVVVPLTGGGFFGTNLPQDALLVNTGFAAVALAYVSVLLAARALARSEVAPFDANRRALLRGAGSTVASLAALWLMRDRVVGRSDLPLAVIEETTPTSSAPTAVAAAPPTIVNAASPATPSPTAGAAATLQNTPRSEPAPTAPTPPAESTVAPTRTAAASRPADEVPQPPAPRDLKREHDGASTAVPRRNGELATLVTPNDRFYITTKNPVSDPVVDGAGWRLVLEGEVARPVQIDYRTLRRLPPVELHRTLECISNFVDKPELAPFGNNLISNAVWRGARLRDVMGLAGGLKPAAGWLTLVTADEFNAVIPVAAVEDPECILAYEMNGEVLPREHGYPTRLLMPGRYGLKSAKWITAIRAQQHETLDWYGQRGWSKDGFVKTMSRIDVPGAGVALAPGSQPAAGVAYAANRGISRVELSADGGRTWRPTEIVERTPNGKDTWIIWRGSFEMPGRGSVTLRVRAIDGKGDMQIEQFSLPQPDGASGWHTVEVKST